MMRQNVATKRMVQSTDTIATGRIAHMFATRYCIELMRNK